MTAPTPFLDDLPIPARFDSESDLEDYMCLPSRALVRDMADVAGDLVVLGAGGKMGPTLARLARQALPAERRVIAVARFSDTALRVALEGCGIETHSADLLDAEAVARLPRAANVVFMAGRKFGADAEQSLTWAMNAHVPALIADAYRDARIVSFSTACVYPFALITGPGSAEGDALAPPGEYAASCVGRERLFEYFSRRHGTPGRSIRLSYAIDLRYGVLADVAQRVWQGQPVDVSMGQVNVIWQGDANAQALRALAATTVPTSPLNVSGPEKVSIRWLAEAFAQRFGKPAQIEGVEQDAAWLVNCAEAQRLFGYPRIPVSTLIDWTADWTVRGGRTLAKPTRFEVRDGRY